MQIGFTSSTFNQIKQPEAIISILNNAEEYCFGKKTQKDNTAPSHQFVIEWNEKAHVKTLNDAQSIMLLCCKNNIEVCSFGSYYRVGSKDSRHWHNVCEKASVTGAKSVRVWLGKCDSQKTDKDTYNELLEDAENMCVIADDYGLKISAECHRNTFNNDTDAILRFMSDLDNSVFYTYFQSIYKDIDTDLDRIERTFDKTANVHISFAESRREQFPKFKRDYADILIEKYKNMDFSGALLLEYSYFYSLFGIQRSFNKDMKNLCIKAGIIK